MKNILLRFAGILNNCSLFFLFLCFLYLLFPLSLKAENTPLAPEIIRELKKEFELIKNQVKKNNSAYRGIVLSLRLLAETRLSPELTREIYLFLAESYSRLDLNDLALTYLNKANKLPLKYSPGTVSEELLKLLGSFQKIHFKKKEYSASLNFYQKITSRKLSRKIDPELTYLAALAAFYKNDYPELIKLTDKLEPESGYSLYAQYLKMAALSRLKPGSERALALKEAAKSFEQLVSRRLLKGENYSPPAREEKRWRGFLEEKIIYALGILHYEGNNYREAIIQFNKLKKSPSFAARALSRKIWCYLKQGKLELAADSAQDLLKYYPQSRDYEKTYFTLGEIYSRLKNYPEAILYFEEGKKRLKSSQNYLQKKILLSKEIEKLISTLERINYSEINYLEDFVISLENALKKINNDRERHFLNLISAEKEIINSRLNFLLKLRKFQNSLLQARIRYLGLYNKYRYVIFYYRKIKNDFKKVLKNLEEIDLSGLKAEITQQKAGDIFKFAFKEEENSFKYLGTALEKTNELRNYLKRLKKEVFSAEEGDPEEDIPLLQDILLSSPLLYQEKDALGGKKHREPILERIIKMNQDIDRLLWEFSNRNSSKNIDKNDQNWQKNYQVLRKVINKMGKELVRSEEQFFQLKMKLAQKIKHDLSGRREFFFKRLKIIGQRKNKLKERINFIISYLDQQIKELSPFREKINQDILRKISFMKKKLQLLSQKSKASLKEVISRKVKGRIKEFEQLLLKSDLAIADNLFFMLIR